MSSQELPQPQQKETKPQVPSSDAVLPSSPSPVKRSTNPEDTSDEQNKSEESKDSENNEPNTSTQIPAENSRLTAFHTKLSTLQTRLTSLQTQRQSHIDSATLPSGLSMPSHWTEDQKSKQALDTANGVIKEHIALLHNYNEIKDIGMGLMGLVADKRGVRVKGLLEEFGMGEKD